MRINMRWPVLFSLILVLLPASGLFALQPVADAADSFDIKSYYLLKPRAEGRPDFAGDRQHGRAGEVAGPLRARVIDQRSDAVSGIPVSFEVVSYPAGGANYQFDRKLVPTDASGMAVVNFRFGSAGGEYQIISRIRSAGEENIQLYTLYARERNWLLFLVVGLAGGLALFLFGLDILSRGMLRAAGDKMRSILGNLTNNRFKALGLGAFVTMVIQSSSATNVMMVSFVNAGLMRFRQTIGVILGAAIGTTVTAQIIAFRFTDFSLLFVALGFTMRAFAGRDQYRHAGDIILGFGLLFFGMEVMSDSMFPLRSYEPFLQLLQRLENPLLGILVGTVFTALIQSSSAFVGILIVLGTQGLISLEASIPLLFGANIGTAVTSLLAGIRTGNEARKVALAVTLFKVFGVLLFVWWIDPFALFIEDISPRSTSGADEMAGLAAVIPRQIANAHMVYNVLMALLVLPFTGLIAAAVDRMMPAKAPSHKPGYNLHYLDDKVLKTPVMALNLAKQEVKRMGGIVYEMVEAMLQVFIERNPAAVMDIELKEKKVNFLRDGINAYLLKITRGRVREQRINEAFQILYTVKELELIADVVSSLTGRRAGKWIEAGYSFSEEGKEELRQYHGKTLRQIARALEVFADINLDKARIIKDKHREYRNIAWEYERQHYQRLKQENHNTLMSSETHLDIMAMLMNISGHATNIARILLQWNHSGKTEET
jgi:phosphate:Na+ symporter